MPKPMRIAAMPETTIDRTSEGEIMIAQKDEHAGDSIVSFPIEMAQKIADEILRLAAAESPDDASDD